MSSDTLQIIIHENSIRILISFIIFYFAVFIHLYDMIKNNNLRMLCRSVSESWLMSLSWLVIGYVGFWCISNKINKIYYNLGLFLVTCIIIFSNLDYHSRLTKDKYNKIFKASHYISTVILLLLLVGYLYITNKSSFYPLFCLLLVFFYLHTCRLNESKLRDFTICLELFIVYFCFYKILLEDQILQNKWITLNNIILKDTTITK